MKEIIPTLCCCVDRLFVEFVVYTDCVFISQSAAENKTAGKGGHEINQSLFHIFHTYRVPRVWCKALEGSTSFASPLPKQQISSCSFCMQKIEEGRCLLSCGESSWQAARLYPFSRVIFCAHMHRRRGGVWAVSAVHINKKDVHTQKKLRYILIVLYGPWKSTN